LENLFLYSRKPHPPENVFYGLRWASKTPAVPGSYKRYTSRLELETCCADLKPFTITLRPWNYFVKEIFHSHDLGFPCIQISSSLYIPKFEYIELKQVNGFHHFQLEWAHTSWKKKETLWFLSTPWLFGWTLLLHRMWHVKLCHKMVWLTHVLSLNLMDPLDIQ